MAKFYAAYIKGNGVKVVETYTADSKEFLESTIKSFGMKVLKVVLTRGHHLCPCCFNIADGAKKDTLCSDCYDIFGDSDEWKRWY